MHKDLSDLVVSVLRTAVPALWGSLLAALLPYLPWLPVEVVEWLTGTSASLAVAAVVIVAWYAAWRRLESRVPGWLVRLVLGSARVPGYSLDPAEILPERRTTQLTAEQVSSLVSLRDALDEGDHARDAIVAFLRATP